MLAQFLTGSHTAYLTNTFFEHLINHKEEFHALKQTFQIIIAHFMAQRIIKHEY